MFQEEFEQENKNLLVVELIGKNPVLWNKLQDKFVSLIFAYLSVEIGKITEDNAHEEESILPKAILEYSKSQKGKNLLGDIQRLAEIENTLADTAKKISEKKSLELDNSVKQMESIKDQLKTILQVMNYITSSNPDVIVFSAETKDLVHFFRRGILIINNHPCL